MIISDWFSITTILTIAVLAGMLNTIVGSGSLFTFPALLALGIPPVPANIANNAGLSVGNLAGVWGYRDYLKGYWRIITPHISATIIGAVFGALLLLRLPAEVFRVVASILIVLGCLLVLFQPTISRLTAVHSHDQNAVKPLNRLSTVTVTTFTGMYGGYFGAAQGVIIVGALGVLSKEPLQRINAIKNVLQTVAGWTATIVFIFIATIPWDVMLFIAAGSLVGARFGAVVGKKIPTFWLRIIIVLVGFSSIFMLL